MDNKELQVPGQSSGDVAHSIVKAGLSAVPVLGGAVVELFQNIVQPSLEKRRAEWMAQVGEKLQKLEDNGLDLEALQENEQFISAAMYASQLALRTHNEEKLKALRNAVANIATGQAPDEAMQHIFLNFVDTLTELHIKIINIFQAPTPPSSKSMGSLSSVLEHNMPEMHGHRELYDQLWKDLSSRGLVNEVDLHITMTGNGLGQKRTTGLGDAFIYFISEPE